MKRFPIFYATEGETIAGSGIAVPVIASPVAQPVHDVNLSPTKVDVAKEIGVDTGLRGPADIFGEEEAPEKVTDRIERDMKGPERGPDGKFLPKKTDAAPAMVKPVAAKPEKPIAAKTEPIAAAPAKIKIGDQEKTAEEWAAIVADKADKPAAEKPAEQAKTEPKPEEIAAQEQSARRAWEDSARQTYAKYMPSQEAVDKALASGDPKELYEMFTLKPMLALEENMRKWSIATFGPHLEQLNGQLTPIASAQEQAKQYQAEHQFIEAHPEIKSVVAADPAKMAVHRQVNEDLRQEIDDMKMLLDANPSNARAKARLDALSSNFLGEMAKETKARYAAGGIVVTPEPAKPAPKKPVAEKPLNGDRPGASSAIKTETNEQRMARELNEHQGV